MEVVKVVFQRNDFWNYRVNNKNNNQYMEIKSMPIIILLAICSFLFVVWIVIKLKHSPRFDKMVNNMTDESSPAEPKIGEVIKKIGAAETALNKKAETNKKEADRLRKEAKTVGEFLTDRGVKADKGKETKPNELNGG